MSAYHVNRNGKRLGVYPEPEARDYFSQGRIGPDDLVWREGMAAWLPASQVFGPAPQADLPGAPPLPLPAAATPGPDDQPGIVTRSSPSAAPLPPRLHWALVLLFTVLTLGIFYIVWMFVQSAWVRRIDPQSNATTLLAVYVVLAVAGQVAGEIGGEGSTGESVGVLLVLAGTVVSVFGFFSMRRSMLDHYNQAEPIGLRLSAALTFFLSVFYLQHHMTRIAGWKQTGALPPL